ncbi:MAG: helix-turn-helix domain-containing protein, partial [Immundisolibacter sp.]|uniref:helix-turn-helix domain-containing protein n=1 Tax=Immundisolibacter sp. TaxID=1934948 RepID=UPI003EE373B2
METQRSYTQLRPEDRVVIAGMTRLGASVRAMARTLERAPSTISRELARNRSPDAGYASQAAHALSGARRVAARPPRKLDPHAVSWGVVRTLL